MSIDATTAPVDAGDQPDAVAAATGADLPVPCCSPVTGGALSEPEAVELADLLGALADPVRLRMFSMIAAAGSVCSCDFVEPLARSQPTISHHTRILASAGLIEGEKDGRWMHWRIVPGRLEALRAALG